MERVPRLGPDDLEAAGLYEPGSAGASERLALLEYLIEIGVTLDELVAAPPDDLPLVASRTALWGARELMTIDDVAAATGVSRALVARAWRAAGFPDPEIDPHARTFSSRDVEIIEILRAAIELFDEAVAIQLLRVLAAAAARVADASASAFIVNVASRAMEEDASGLALARANAESMALLDGVTRGFDTLLRHHMERAFRPRGAIGIVGGVDLVQRSVGFADLADSTAWAQQLELGELGQALSAFEATAAEIVVARDGRVVKLIGDEVMFVANEPAAAVDIALALVDAFAAHPVLPPVRVGIATGEVLARDGDFSGPVVNLAARAVKSAELSTVLADTATGAALHDQPAVQCGAPRAYPLKGFRDDVQLVAVHRAAAS